MNELIMTTLYNLVKSMREKQVEYFKTRDKQALLEAKYLEQKVDSFIASVDNHNIIHKNNKAENE